MARKRKALQEGAQATAAIPPEAKPLTWKEEKFVEAYIDFNENGTRAYQRAYGEHLPAESAKVMASRMLTRINVQEAIQFRREQIRQALAFDRDKWLRILVAQATAKQSDFANVLKDPSKKTNYKGLGDLEYAIEEASMTDKSNRVKLANRKAALDELRDVLGFNNPGDPSGGSSDDLGLAEEASRISRSRQTA